VGGNGQVTLSWTAAAGAANYNVKRSTNSGAETIIGNSPTAVYTDTNLVNGRTYYYVVSAANALGEGGNSSEASATTSSTNLVQNGGFETGDFTSWTLSGNTNNTFVDEFGSSGITPNSGMWEADVGTTGAHGYLSQTLSTTAGASYLLSFWVNNSFGDTNVFLVSWNGTNVFGSTDLPAIGWTYIPIQVSATGANTVLQFGFEDDVDFLGLDDVSVVPTSLLPAPSPTAPKLGGITFTGGSGSNGCGFGFCFTNAPSCGFTVYASTNLMTPFSNWTVLGHPIEITNGACSQYQFTDSQTSNKVQRFYRVSSP
jgi:hypothetical protein